MDVSIKCGYCKNKFSLNQRYVNGRLKKSKSGLLFCSNRCAIDYHYKNRRNTLTKKFPDINCNKCGIKIIRDNCVFRTQNVLRYTCKKCSNKYGLIRQNKIKIGLVKYFGGKCNDCGISGHPIIFEFHRLHGRDLNISRFRGRKFELALKKANECIMLCRICHRSKHTILALWDFSNPIPQDNVSLRQQFYWNRLKIRAVSYLGNKCQKCGFNGMPSSYDFHHPNPSIKEYEWSILRKRSWETITSELDKCELLCANCHNLVHLNPDHWVLK